MRESGDVCETGERHMWSEEVTDYKIAKNAGCEAITTIFILLANGNLVRWITISYREDSLLRYLTWF